MKKIGILLLLILLCFWGYNIFVRSSNQSLPPSNQQKIIGTWENIEDENNTFIIETIDDNSIKIKDSSEVNEVIATFLEESSDSVTFVSNSLSYTFASLDSGDLLLASGSYPYDPTIDNSLPPITLKKVMN